MSSKHTKGPWTLLTEEADKDYLRIRGTRFGGRYKVANVHRPRFEGVHPVVRERDDAESMANARLIAAAPDLLEALKNLDEAYCRSGRPLTRAERHEDRQRLIAARAAIAKATGEPQ